MKSLKLLKRKFKKLLQYSSLFPTYLSSFTWCYHNNFVLHILRRNDYYRSKLICVSIFCAGEIYLVPSAQGGLSFEGPQWKLEQDLKKIVHNSFEKCSISIESECGRWTLNVWKPAILQISPHTLRRIMCQYSFACFLYLKTHRWDKSVLSGKCASKS